MQNLIMGVVISVWLVLSCAGLAVFNRYEFTPGRSAQPAAVWPRNAPVKLDDHRLTLLLAAHPHCACSNETVAQLQQLLLQYPGRAVAHVFFFTPAGADADWASGSLWSAAQSLPDSSVSVDVAGAQAARFDAHTSGQLLVYTPEGRLVFAGGITTSRGHGDGWNVGLERLSALLAGQPAPAAGLPQSPVYGCSLDEPDAGLPAGSCGVKP